MARTSASEMRLAFVGERRSGERERTVFTAGVFRSPSVGFQIQPIHQRVQLHTRVSRSHHLQEVLDRQWNLLALDEKDTCAHQRFVRRVRTILMISWLTASGSEYMSMKGSRARFTVISYRHVLLCSSGSVSVLLELAVEQARSGIHSLVKVCT